MGECITPVLGGMLDGSVVDTFVISTWLVVLVVIAGGAAGGILDTSAVSVKLNNCVIFMGGAFV